jgi:hypothetical protein
MKNFLEKYNATKLETNQDEGKLSLESCKRRILNILDENMKNFKNNSWNLNNRMNKLIIDKENNSIFTLRLGGKKIIRYSLFLLNTQEKLDFLSDFYDSIVKNEYDTEILNFLADEISKTEVRKKATAEKRREKKKQKKAEAEKRTWDAAKQMINEQIAAVAQEVTPPRYAQL